MACECETDICATAGSSLVLMARVKTTAGDYMTLEDIDSVRVDVVEVDDDDRVAVNIAGDEVTTGAAFSEPDKEDVAFDDLQMDDRWKKDSTGFNALTLFTPTHRDRRYEVRMTLTMTNGTKAIPVWRVNAR